MEEESEEWQLELWFLLVDDTEANEGGEENCELLPNVHQ